MARKKEDRALKLLAAESRLPAWLHRGTNTLFIVLAWPCILVGVVYLAAFLLLNSSQGPKILHSQLGNFLRGDYFAATMKTDALLKTLTMTDVRLVEAGQPGHVIWAPLVEAEIPLWTLGELSNNTLKVGRIKVYHGDVYLNFTKGELNILKVVLPYFGKPDYEKKTHPEPEDPNKTPFTTWLSDLNVEHTDVHLVFDGFRIDLLDTKVDNYEIRIDNLLRMTSPRRGLSNAAIHVQNGQLTFHPALFSFPLSEIGDRDEGLVLSGKSGTGGAVAHAFGQMALHIDEILCDAGEGEGCRDISGVPEAMRPWAHALNHQLSDAPRKRGTFIIPLHDTYVDGFHWVGNTFYIPDMQSDVGGGHVTMNSAMMNVGPTQEEMDAHEKEHGLELSGGHPRETILWAAKIALDLPVQDPILSYFFGPVLFGESDAHLRADMAGDLGRASGDIELDIADFAPLGIETEQLALRARMDGQNLAIRTFEADTEMGAVLLRGKYAIMDGDFDLNLWAGKEPKDESDFIVPDLAKKLAKGIDTGFLLEDENYPGILSAQLQLQSQDGTIAVSLPTPMQYELHDPIVGMHRFRIAPESAKNTTILTYRDGILNSPAGLQVTSGTDEIRVRPGLRFNTNDLEDLAADVEVNIAQPGKLASYFGVEGLQMDRLSMSAQYRPGSRDRITGGVFVDTSNVSFRGLRIDTLRVRMPIKDSTVRMDATNNIFIKTNVGTVAVEGTFDFGSSKLPMDMSVRLTDLDLERFFDVDWDSLIACIVDPSAADTVPSLSTTSPVNALIRQLGLKGRGEGTVTAKGSLADPQVRLFYSMNDVEVMEVPMSRISLISRYEKDQVQIPAFNIWFDPSELPQEEGAEQTVELTPSGRRRVPRRTPDFSLGALTYDMKTDVLQFNVALQPLSPNKFKPFRDLELPLETTVSFDISTNLDLGVLSNSEKTFRKALKASWIEGNLNLDALEYAGMHLGNTRIDMSRSNQYALFRGNIIDMLDLTGFVRTAPRMSLSLSLDFPDLDVLATIRRLGFDFEDMIQQFGLHQAKISGSIGLCAKSLDNMTASLILDDISFDVLGNELTLTQPAIATYNIQEETANLRQFELKYRDSILKLSGQYSLNGNVSFDVNGEIDAAIAKSALSTLQTALPDAVEPEVETADANDAMGGSYRRIVLDEVVAEAPSGVNIKDAAGLFGISLTGKGTLNTKGGLPDIDIKGYMGVRNPIMIQTDFASSPFEIRQGFVLFDNRDPRCKGSRLCLYTPPDLGFEFGVNGEWLRLGLFANSKGDFAVQLAGNLNASAAQLVMKDISSASGNILVSVDATGNIPLGNAAKMKDFRLLEHVKVGGRVEVGTPVTVEMRSLPDPITLDDGLLLITEGNDCGGAGKQCITIPSQRAFQGNLMGGNYRIFGDIQRHSITPKSGDLSIFANNVSFRMKDELFITVSPDIRITAKDFTNWDTVKIAGDIDIAEARYKKDFDDGSSNFIKEQILSMFISSKKRVDTYSPSFLRKWPFLGKINLDIGLLAENTINVDVKIATAIVQLELGSQLRIGGTIKDFAPSGIFSISEGIFSLRDNEFEFQNGAQIAFNGSLDGKIDITATTEINTDSNAFSAVTGNTDLDRRKRISSNSSSASDLYAITLTVGGTIFRPVWSFESSPYLSDTNVYALILTGRTIEDFSGNDVAMESLLSPLFSSQLDTFINADEFNFVLSQGAAQFVYVKQISKALRIAAGVSIRGADGNEQALSAQYNIHDWDKKTMFLDLTGQNTSDEEGRAPTFKLGATLHYHLPLP